MTVFYVIIYPFSVLLNPFALLCFLCDFWLIFSLPAFNHV